MGEIHNEIRKGWLSQAVNRALGRTRDGGIERLGETVTPILNAWGMPEWAFLRGERLCGGRVALGAGAATELGNIALLNPTGSGMIVVVEQATVDIPVTNQVLVQMGADPSAQLTGASVGSNVDTRWANATEPVAKLRSLAFPSSALGVTFYQQNIPALTPVELLLLPVVVSPGFAIIVCSIDDAAALRVSYRWRERKAYPGELV